MPSSPNSIGGASLSANPAKINNPKSVIISVADNGFVLQLSKVTEYGQSYKVAKDVSEIPDIITAYFAPSN